MNDQNRPVETVWIRAAAFSGLAACVVYPLLIFVPMPLVLQVVLGGAFGPALMVACFGLYHLLRLHRDSVTIQIAAVSNALAGALVTAMIIAQLAVRSSTERYLATPGADASVKFIRTRIWDVILGLDVSFDVFIGLGTLLFGLGMLGHPRFGKVVGIAGMLVGGVVIWGFNAATFPDPPKEAGLFDPGPVTGLWYLWVVVLSFRSFGWADRKLAGDEP